MEDARGQKNISDQIKSKTDAYIQEAVNLINGRTRVRVKINGRNINMQIFVDGIAVIAEQKEDLQEILRTVQKALINELGMKINTKKTKVLVCSKKNYIKIKIYL